MTRTRQHRISNPLKIVETLKRSTGKTLQLVLADARVIIGVIDENSATDVTVSNMRLKKMRIPLNQISEIYIDTLE